MLDSKEFKIINTIDICRPRGIIQTPCGKFLIGIEGNSIFRYCLETKQKFRIAGLVKQWGHQDGTWNESRFNLPQGLSLSKDLKTLFVTDFGNRVIRAICVGTGVTTTISGQFGLKRHVDGPNGVACFKKPRSLKLSPDGNTLMVSDHKKLRTVCITTGQVDTITTFKNDIHEFTFSPDGKRVIISFQTRVLKYNLETTQKSEIVLEGQGFLKFDISKDGQVLFISNYLKRGIQLVNLVTNQVIDTITLPFEPQKMTISTNAKQLYVLYYYENKIQVFDISKYCTNFKTFTQSQFSKHSFLSRAVVKRLKI
jgi:DNA-binding beta-propeller fold protein YncE